MTEPHYSSARDLGFPRAVESAFGFLKAEGFSRVHETPTQVRYEAGPVFVNVYHGRESFELGVEIGMTTLDSCNDGSEGNPAASCIDSACDGEKFTIWEIARAAGAQDVDENTFLQASSREAVARCVERLAEFVYRYANRALSGDLVFYQSVRAFQKVESDRFVKNSALKRAISRSSPYWRQKDYRRVVELLAPVELDLPALQQRKLAYARSKVKDLA